MAKAKMQIPFEVQAFLNTVNGGREIISFRKNEKIFSQDEACDAVFYLKEGQVKLCVISEHGKEAVVAIDKEGAFSVKDGSPEKRRWPLGAFSLTERDTLS